jgi:hypothetical protein
LNVAVEHEPGDGAAGLGRSIKVRRDLYPYF